MEAWHGGVLSGFGQETPGEGVAVVTDLRRRAGRSGTGAVR